MNEARNGPDPRDSGDCARCGNYSTNLDFEGYCRACSAEYAAEKADAERDSLRELDE